MTNPMPFLSAPGRSQMQATLDALNQPSFLVRTMPVPLDDNTTDGRTMWGLVSTDALMDATPRYCCGSTNCSPPGTAVFAKDILRAVPFLHLSGFAVTALSFAVTTAQANSSARVGIYGCAGDLRGDMTPSTLIFDGGSVATTATGLKTTAATLLLEEGRWYWAVYVCTTTGTAPTINSIAVAGQDALAGWVPSAASLPSTHLSVAFTYAALPSAFPAGSTMQTTQSPAVFVTYARASATLRTRTIPMFCPRTPGYTLRGVRLSSGSTLAPDASAGAPYTILKAQTRGTSGTHTVGTFDTRKNKVTAGTPYDMTGGDIDLPVAQGAELVMSCAQYGWPKVSMKGVTAWVDYIYTGSGA